MSSDHYLCTAESKEVSLTSCWLNENNVRIFFSSFLLGFKWKIKEKRKKNSKSYFNVLCVVWIHRKFCMHKLCMEAYYSRSSACIDTSKVFRLNCTEGKLKRKFFSYIIRLVYTHSGAIHAFVTKRTFSVYILVKS